MTMQTEFEPFAAIIQQGLAKRSAKGAVDTHPEHSAPRYVVSICEALTKAIREAGNPGVTLAAVVRMESTCTGADYVHKLALRSHRLAHGAAV